MPCACMPGESYCEKLRSLLLCFCVMSYERKLTPLFVDSVNDAVVFLCVVFWV